MFSLQNRHRVHTNSNNKVAQHSILLVCVSLGWDSVILCQENEKMEELDIFLFSVLSSFELGSDIEKKTKLRIRRCSYFRHSWLGQCFQKKYQVRWKTGYLVTVMETNELSDYFQITGTAIKQALFWPFYTKLKWMTEYSRLGPCCW